MAPRSNARERGMAFRGLEEIKSKAGGIVSDHPTEIRWSATALGAFLSSFIFIIIISYGTALFTTHCTVKAGGVLEGICDYIPNYPDSMIGTHPNFQSNILQLALVAYIGTFMSRHISGLWTRAEPDLHFTILRIVKSFFLKDEPLRLGHRLTAVLFQALSVVCAMPLIYGLLQGRSSYADGGEGMGGPGLSIRALQKPSSTIAVVILIGFIRGTAYLWSTLERKWTQTNTQTHGTHEHPTDRDPFTVGMTHHANAHFLAAVDAGLVIVFGSLVGSIGHFWRDMSALVVTAHPSMVSEADEGFSLWLLTTVIVFLGYIISLVVFFGTLALIRKSEGKTMWSKGD